MNTRFLIAPIAFAISLTFVGAAASPAIAAPANVCTTLPTQIRSVATTATPENVRKALTMVSTGEKLCAEGGKFEAGKKFAAAAKLLGTDIAALTAQAPTAQ